MKNLTSSFAKRIAKNISPIVAGAALLCAAALPSQAALQGAPDPARPVFTALGAPTFVASNMSTNIASSPFVLYRERPVAFFHAGRTVTNEATKLTGFLEFSTNRPGATSTQWFRPVTPVSIQLSTNHSGIVTNYQSSLLANSSIPDGALMARFWSWNNSSTTNGLTNSALTSAVIP